jgi:hypothetical protein
MRDEYDFSKGVRGKYINKISSWVLEPEVCRFCGKLTYTSLNDAEYAAKRSSQGKQTISTYACPYETGWHLTSKQR